MPHKALAETYKIKKGTVVQLTYFNFDISLELKLGYGFVGSYLFPQFSQVYEAHRK
jgi:hypothetical protein